MISNYVANEEASLDWQAGVSVLVQKTVDHIHS